MKREIRYLVMKLRDLDAALTDTERDILSAIASKVELHRQTAGKRFLRCVVVEDDWPEYEPTWTAIAARMDQKPNAEAHGRRSRTVQPLVGASGSEGK